MSMNAEEKSNAVEGSKKNNAGEGELSVLDETATEVLMEKTRFE